jgi:hypothetical protein
MRQQSPWRRRGVQAPAEGHVGAVLALRGIQAQGAKEVTDEERATLEAEYDDVDQEWGKYMGLNEARPLRHHEKSQWELLGKRRQELKALLGIE